MPEVRVIMIEPRYSFNLALVARTMKNFGYSDLCLVRPKEGVVKQAKIYSARAASLLNITRVFPRLPDALEGVDLKVGTSAKLGRRSRFREFIRPEELAHISTQFDKTGLVLGRESSGLTNEELAMMDLNTRIATDPSYPTLNVAISAAIILYELSKALELQPRDYELAQPLQIEGFLRAYCRLLDAFGFTRRRVDTSKKAFGSLIKKASPSSKEIGLLASNTRKMGSIYLEKMKNK